MIEVYLPFSNKMYVKYITKMDRLALFDILRSLLIVCLVNFLIQIEYNFCTENQINKQNIQIDTMVFFSSSSPFYPPGAQVVNKLLPPLSLLGCLFQLTPQKLQFLGICFQVSSPCVFGSSSTPLSLWIPPQCLSGGT